MTDDTRRRTRTRQQDDGTLPDDELGGEDETLHGIWSWGAIQVDSRPDAPTEDAVQRFKERLKRAARERAANPPHSGFGDDANPAG